MHRLSQEGIAINTTAILSFNQAMPAAKAGATYVSIFAGRVADEGNDPATVIRNVRRWLDDWEFSTRIIVGSIRTVIDIQNAALAGAHIITIPPQFLPKMVDHRYTREAVRQFVQNAQKTLAERRCCDRRRTMLSPRVGGPGPSPGLSCPGWCIWAATYWRSLWRT